jgi:hypothetical protein
VVTGFSPHHHLRNKPFPRAHLLPPPYPPPQEGPTCGRALC